MARFFGSVQGSRGKAHRIGGASSGLHTVAAGWQGAVDVTVYDKDGTDWCEVCLVKWQGNGEYRVVYTGPISGVRKKGGTK